ncbi:MAG: protein kinase [Prochlorococcaceae cyanobacterium]
MQDPAAPAPGVLIGERYRLEQPLSQGSQGQLWRAADQLAAGTPVVLRQLPAGPDQERFRRLWSRLQGVLHPQVPRFGALIPRGEELWLVREWQAGRTLQQLLEARAERQLVFGAGEVLLLLRQLLPVLAVLHGQELLHGDLTPSNLLRRDSDGLPVLLDFGLLRGLPAAGRSGSAGASPALLGCTPGYGPPELLRGAAPEPWMDLYSLGVVAMVLLSGDAPEALLDPVTLQWRWPAALEQEPGLRQLLQRLLSDEPRKRFPNAAQALQAIQELPMPESTGPVPRADRTLVLVPKAVPEPEPEPGPEASPESPSPEPPSPEPPPPAEPDLPLDLPVVRPPVPPPPRASQLRRSGRRQARDEAGEGGLWPVVIALVVSAVLGTTLGWWWLGRGRVPADPEAAIQLPSSLPAAEVDQRQQLLSRLRALQIDRAWFLKLVDASLLAQFPERGGRLPSDSSDDAPLRRIWNEQAEEWLARVEALPLPLRRRLGSFTIADWERRQRALAGQGLSPAVLRQLVSDNAQNLLPGRSRGGIPPEPFRQLWLASAETGLESLQIEAIDASSAQTRVLSAQVDAGGARLFPIRLPAGHRLVLGVNGSPLMQMSVFAADGTPLEARGPLRVVSLPAQTSTPLQLLVTNEGLAAGLITLSLRADPPAPQAPAPVPQPAEPPEPAAGAEPPDASEPAPRPAEPGAGAPPPPEPPPPG